MKTGWLLFIGGIVALLLFVFIRPEQAIGQPNNVETDLKQFIPLVLGGTGDLEPTATATSALTPTAEACAPTDGLLRNPGFEAGDADWVFFTSGQGSYTTAGPAYECELAAQLSLTGTSNNIQFYQSGFLLKAGSRYRLTFSAYSNSGHNVEVLIHQHTAPYKSLGLSYEADLSEEWQTLSTEFVAEGFSGSTTDTRLRFWFPRFAQDGDVYWLDDVRLEEMDSAPTVTPGPTNTPAPGSTNTPVPTPTNTPAPGATSTPKPPPATRTPQPTATPNPGGGRELLVFDLDRKVTEADRGFPHDTPPMANGNWITPVNYADGTLYYRIEVHSQPVPQDMLIQFCFWQEKNGSNFGLENCGPTQRVRGTSGTVETWSVKVRDMWKLNGKSIEWNRPRFRNGMAIKNKNGDPVSNFNGWNWNGEDPKKWYPLDISFKVVVVANGAQFSGWENYTDLEP